MGMQSKYEDDKHEKNRQKNRNQYHNGNGKRNHRLKYLQRKNEISNEDLQQFNTIEEKLRFCEVVHIKNRHKGVLEVLFED